MAYSPYALLLPSSTCTALRRFGAAALIALPLAVLAQAPAAQQPASPAAAPQDQSTSSAEASPASAGKTPIAAEPQAVVAASVAPNGGKLPVTLEILQERLVGKQFFLRGGWLGDSLNFTERGIPANEPKTGSFTLSMVEIHSVNWDGHHVEIEGTRYALHFLGNLPYETTAHQVEQINITPKRPLHISIARAKIDKGGKAPHAAAAKSSPETTQPADAATATASATDAAAGGAPGSAASGKETQGKETQGGKPVKNFSQAAQILNDALERIFAPALDTTMRAQLPEFWQLYYESQRSGQRFNPHDGRVFRASAVDQQARILTSIAPQSNEYAQNHNIVGVALYRVVIGADGTPQQIAADRPIGFGLDENAVAAIRKATFQPAVKGGQPVAELVDLSVVFRIFSNLTNGSAQMVETADGSTPAPVAPRATVKAAMPGPFATPQPAQQQPAAQQTAPQPADQPAENAPIVVDDGPLPTGSQTTTPQTTQPAPHP